MTNPFISQSKACRKVLKEFKTKKRYHKLNPVGEGGIARVVSYFDKYLHRIIAEKELHPSKSNNPHLLRAFTNEAKLMSYLEHPGVVSVYDMYFTDEDKVCYSMQLIEGIRLGSLLGYRADGKEQTGVALNQLLEIFTKICETLAYVHDKGVIHLDIKPDNILIGKYGEVTIMDWGNARLYNPKPYFDYFKQYLDNIALAHFEREAEHVILGTPHYMSPEQTNSSRDTLTPASDIFSAGLILYQMLTGKHPFSHVDETQEILVEVRTFKPKPAHQLNSDIPVRLSMICEHMLEKDPLQRYQNFKEILEDLNDYKNSGQAFALRTYQTGDVIFRQGDPGDYSFKIVSGCVEVSKITDGKKTVFAILGKDEFVGELAIFSKQPRSATITALETTTIRVMDKLSVQKELEKLNPWVSNMIEGLSDKLIEMNRKMAGTER